MDRVIGSEDRVSRDLVEPLVAQLMDELERSEGVVPVMEALTQHGALALLKGSARSCEMTCGAERSSKRLRIGRLERLESIFERLKGVFVSGMVEQVKPSA